MIATWLNISKYLAGVAALAVTLGLLSTAPAGASDADLTRGAAEAVAPVESQSGPVAARRSCNRPVTYIESVRRDRARGSVLLIGRIEARKCTNGGWRIKDVRAVAKRSKARCGRVQRIFIDPDAVGGRDPSPVKPRCVNSEKIEGGIYTYPVDSASYVPPYAGAKVRCMEFFVRFISRGNDEVFDGPRTCMS